MQQGMLSSVLLCASLFIGVPSAYATEMQPREVERLIDNPQIHQKVAELQRSVVQGNADSLSFALERMALPQQEVARYLLLKKIEANNIPLTPQVVRFIERQKNMAPVYQVLERGEGYEFSVPAFNYPAIASRIIKRWQQDTLALEFVLQAERGELDLKNWLSGDEYQIQAKEALFIRELNGLSSKAIEGLVSQLTDETITSWLPSSQIMVGLAQASRNVEIYKLLWLMRADYHSQSEIRRLAEVGNEFAIAQIINASYNPSLKEQAIKELARIKPMTEEIKAFLIDRMTLHDEASMVATELASQGYTPWLKELANDNPQVRSHAILNALSQ
ncbi:hypothetical protein GCM10007938_27690 [Vibrio zhanjiangensis]|uniref:HEAT repeat domain-containing protein n=1 Tax=Vibrio zhanjiangensis TaxID=1046128 RepID=A0ABQ6F2Q5_9VIBR|nr:hypothetical protein [Vibrio zhanjiangensis]GLT18987.1 hypothetical protein GCM10007938_27690 [Vibrio zhanjiangensis]